MNKILEYLDIMHVEERIIDTLDIFFDDDALYFTLNEIPDNNDMYTIYSVTNKTIHERCHVQGFEKAEYVCKILNKIIK